MRETIVVTTLFCILCIGCGPSAEDRIAIEDLKRQIAATESELVRQRSELAAHRAKYRIAHNGGHRSSEKASAVLGQETQEEMKERIKEQESLIERLEEELAGDKKLLAEIE